MSAAPTGSMARPRLTLRALQPRETEIQSGALHLLSMMPHEIAWAMRANAGRWVIVRPPPTANGWRQLHDQIALAVQVGILSSSQVGWVEGGPQGVPDIIGQMARTGEVLGIEVKRPGKNPTLPQRAFLDGICKNGGAGFVANDIDQLPELIRNWRNNRRVATGAMN